MALRSHGDSRLQHVIKLGAHTKIQRYLRITFVGHLQSPGSGLVRTTHKMRSSEADMLLRQGIPSSHKSWLKVPKALWHNQEWPSRA